MSIFTDLPTTTKTEFKIGDNHIGVWALQRFLNSYNARLPQYPLAEDGDFGPRTEWAVEWYQGATDANVDGIVGPQTQARIVRSCIVKVDGGTMLPAGLLEGQMQAESGRKIAAVNVSVPGGIDCGLTQRRVYGPPFSAQASAAAFDPVGSTNLAVNENVSGGRKGLLPNYTTFSGRVGAGEYAWRLAALAHNWPSAADSLSRGFQLSTKRATVRDIIGYNSDGSPRYGWIPLTARFDDGAPVTTYREWAQFYAMGSALHHHAGLVTKLAFGVPVR